MLEQLTELRETLTYIDCFLNMKKDTDEQVDKKAHRARSRRVPSTGTSVPVDMGCSTLSAKNVFTALEALQILYFEDFYGGFITEAQWIISSVSSSCPLPGGWKMGLKVSSF